MFFFLSSASGQDEVVLNYRFPSDKTVHYVNTGKVVQDMDVNGQSMQVYVSSYLGCDIKSKAEQDVNQHLEITVDSLGETVDSPQGMSGGSVKDATGKVITIVISPKGKELDMSDARKTVINIDGSSVGDLSQSFEGFFPRLPDGPVKPGYKWSTVDTVDNKSSVNSLLMIVKADNTFEGMEKIGESECAKITSVLQGTRLMNNQVQGMELKISGPFTGNSELYFSPSDGYFLKYIVTTKMKGEIEMISPSPMTFPVIMDVTSINEVKR
jgi:hypothetical protein